MTCIPVYSYKNSKRLVFVLDWLIKEQLQLDYKLLHDERALHDLPFFISYGTKFPNSLSIPDATLLWEKGIREHEIKTGKWNNVPTLYERNVNEYSITFDLFSALFFLLSRYEEYYPYTPDLHGRYPASQSILYTNGWLQRPIADEWVQAFRGLLQSKFHIAPVPATFSHLPTYDIDIAWSYKNKGFLRTVGAQMRDIWKRNKAVYKERMAVLMNHKQDPYDSYQWMRELHADSRVLPVYFMLSSLNTTALDKNIHPLHPRMQQLTRSIATYADIGLHPSYFSDNDKTFADEKQVLEKVIGETIITSRQHYIRLKLPDTCLRLMRHGISQDYSMGYATNLGFRAGTGQSFYWYSLNNEFTTPLRMHPFCFMDTTALFDERLDCIDAFLRLREMTKILQDCNSKLTTIFHNFSLGSAPEWTGWKESYAGFVAELKLPVKK